MRIVAKIIDWLFFMILSLCCITFITAMCMKIFGGGLANNFHEVIVSLEGLTDSNQILDIILANKSVVFVSLLIGNIIMFLASILYFGVIGKKMSGSLGKSLCKFKVVCNNKKDKLTFMKLISREPIVYIQVITIICTLISFVFYAMSLVTIFAIFVVVFYFRKREFWNEKNNVMVVKI